MNKQVGYIISVQRALLGNLTNNMNAITISYNNSSFILKVYFEKEPSEDEIESLSEITSEVAADFPNINKIQELYLVNNNDNYKEEILDVWIIKKRRDCR